MKKYILICLVIILSGCKDQTVPVVNDSETYLIALQILELNPKSYKSYQRYYSEILDQMLDWLGQINEPEELRTLFWKCHSIWRNKPEGSQDKLTWIDPHCESMNLILYRLGDIQTLSAAKVLVELWCDPKAGWDAGRAEMAGDAVVQCGKLALPFLREIKDSEKEAIRIIKLIESGATSGF